MTLNQTERDRMYQTAILQLETAKRALTASVIRLWEQAEHAEAENERLRDELQRVRAA